MFQGLEVGEDHSSIVVPAVTATSKLFTDARGWLAHAHHSTLFLRVFPDLTLDQAAPRQAEVEMYFDPERDYIELENQGAYVTLAPGQSLTYPVEWRFRAIDPERADGPDQPRSCLPRSTPCSIRTESRPRPVRGLGHCHVRGARGISGGRTAGVRTSMRSTSPRRPKMLSLRSAGIRPSGHSTAVPSAITTRTFSASACL